MDERKPFVIVDGDFSPDKREVLAALLKTSCIMALTGAWGAGDTQTAVAEAKTQCGGNFPVYAGCPKPLVRRLYQKEDQQNSCAGKIAGEHAVSFLIRALRSAETPLVLTAIGPLTNLAMALRIAPDIGEKIEKILVLGSGTPAGEYAEENFRKDPEAAEIVLQCGAPVWFFPNGQKKQWELQQLTALFKAKELPEVRSCSGHICLDHGFGAGVLLQNGEPGHIFVMESY